jgi:hypothetical protein
LFICAFDLKVPTFNLTVKTAQTLDARMSASGDSILIRAIRQLGKQRDVTAEM